MCVNTYVCVSSLEVRVSWGSWEEFCLCVCVCVSMCVCVHKEVIWSVCPSVLELSD